ncbi:MAG: sigma 54-interacting transcriptional regulator [Acidobacteriota bacterium]|nr:sigma 54-interacting transcriptional regulator [Acidobacteriota bacterium]
MRSLMRRAKLIAKEEGPVLIQGETGTGKTHLAGELHEISDRKGHRFMDYGCGEWSPAMLESALFGHSKDAYTSSLTFQKGLLAETNGGTLVLNDIDLLSPAMQGKLLRFLDDGTFTRLGEPGTPIVVDVRIIATSNKNLDALMKQGLFLRDLYYRLRRWRLTIPPLRERPEDLRDLAGKFLEDFQNQRDRSEEDHRWFFHNDVHNLFTSMNWNGNVRDLRSAVENIALFCDGDRKPITLEQASAVLFDEEYKFETHSVDTDEQLRKVLYSTRWNISLTSRITTLSRTTIYKRIRQNGWRQPKA